MWAGRLRWGTTQMSGLTEPLSRQYTLVAVEWRRRGTRLELATVLLLNGTFCSNPLYVLKWWTHSEFFYNEKPDWRAGLLHLDPRRTQPRGAALKNDRLLGIRFNRTRWRGSFTPLEKFNSNRQHNQVNSCTKTPRREELGTTTVSG